MRDWTVKRRERTRHLIELGGLVVKAGLVELTGDDRAVLYGAFIELADMLQGEACEQIIALWRRQGSRAFKLIVPDYQKDECRDVKSTCK
jgi:hypothetical protein